MKRLIVNADDFGLAPGVNDAVMELNRAGALSSATLMAGARSFTSAVHLAFAQTSLAVGCHIVLLDGSPVLSPRQVPSLIDPERPGSQYFRPALGDFVRDLLRGRIVAAEIEAEATAQIQRIQSSGLSVSHIDSHKHTHLFSRVLVPLLRAARQRGVLAVRNPFEPAWSRRATPRARVQRRMQVLALQPLRSGFVRRIRSHGMLTTDGSIGVLATGNLDSATLRAFLGNMPDGTWELVCHPGYCDAALREAKTRLLESREVERAALLEAIPPALEKDPSLRLIDFYALAGSRD